MTVAERQRRVDGGVELGHVPLAVVAAAPGHRDRDVHQRGPVLRQQIDRVVLPVDGDHLHHVDAEVLELGIPRGLVGEAQAGLRHGRS
jgi:hypothetical protein